MLKVKLTVDLINAKFDGTMILKGTEFEVEECEDTWTIPGETFLMYKITDGNDAGKLLHRCHCKKIGGIT